MLRPGHKRGHEPSRDGFSRPLGDFEADRPPGFTVDDRSAVLDPSGRIDVSDLQLHQVASAQIAVDGEIDARQLAGPLSNLEADSDRPPQRGVVSLLPGTRMRACAQSRSAD